ncbi:glycosyltransferase [Streptomyces sp. H39-S7]|uniref:glycosyltransferase n=1 Tax=Streptomyces sp. H39-S7 TaxID=3004357 RepID=UPI0022B0085D|nr:glycosyltransferase [Streptomyces sp. H39-S7]MCZ4117957.1 glycosyltransferase [Streptomyces sp. H39-S7]
MKVLHIITGLDVGGAEQQLRLLLRHLPVSCEVITLTHPGAVADGIRADGTPVTHLGMNGNRDLTVLPRLTRLIRAGHYDLVHTHLYRACVYGRIAARLAGVRTVVATEHSLGATTIEGRPLTRGTRALYRGTEKLGSATVAVSDTVAERLRAWGIPGPRIHTVPNGIDAGAFRFDAAVRAATRTRLGLPPDAFVVGGVGRLVPGKRFDLLVRAVAHRPGARLLLAGAGPERDALLSLAAGLGAADRIHLLGETGGGDGPGTAPALPALLAAVDLFVSASREETFGLAVLEALAAGLPVLYVTCPAIDDLPAAHAPGARRIGAAADALAAALRQHQEAGPHRLPVPAAVGHYDIAGTAGRLAALYALAAARP